MSSAEIVPHTDIAELEGLADRLRASFDAGRSRPLERRRAALEGIASLVAENVEPLLDALRADLGKPAVEALSADLMMVTDEAKAAIKQLGRWSRPVKVGTPLATQPARSWILNEPLGVVLVIAPWNYPVQLLLVPCVGAIAAGNCVVMKPSEVTPHVSALLGELVPRYLDPDCFQIVEGGVPETTALLEQRFDHIFYTGNGTVGRIVMQAAARNLTPVTLELGGKSPCIVERSADLPVAARRIAWGKWMNAGQTCIAPDYLLVEEAIVEPFLEELRACVQSFYGEDPQSSPDYARIVSAGHFRRLEGLLKEAGEIVLGGQRDEASRYIAPTILRNVPADSGLLSEEIFGPLLPVVAVDDCDEAIRYVAAREKPLALYLFTSDAEVEKQVLEGTSSGGAAINATVFHASNPKLPFGGVGPSGMGAYHGKHGFDTFSHRKSVLRKATRIDPKMMYPPYRASLGKMLRRMIG